MFKRIKAIFLLIMVDYIIITSSKTYNTDIVFDFSLQKKPTIFLIYALLLTSKLNT